MKRRFLGALAAMALVVVACGGGSSEANGQPTESVLVRGDWTIEVFNDDGAFVERRQFSNALDTGLALVQILAHDRNLRGWSVDVWGENRASSTLHPCVAPPSQPTTCRISEPGMYVDSSFDFGTLAVADESVGIDAALKLAGSFVAGRDGQVGRVSTSIELCTPPDQGPGCVAGGSIAFTSHVLTPDEVVVVSEGDTVSVEVEIAFGSG